MKIIKFPKKSPPCHCERSRLGGAKQSRQDALTGIASSSRGGTPRNDRKYNKTILALGAESVGNFSIFHKEKIFFSDDFGDLLDENNFKKFQKAVLKFLKKNKIKPDIILTDLHPLYKTTIWGMELSKKFKVEHSQVQHHIAHIFSAVGENMLNSKFKILNPKQIQSRIVLRDKIQNSFFGIALDGTGYGLDGKIWGGEIFECRMSNVKCRIKRIGRLENQIMIGSDLAIREPARMLISILNKFSTFPASTEPRQGGGNFQSSNNKEFIYHYVKKYYTKNQFELLYNQLRYNFNCQETSSAGRILDAVSVLLGFCGNERKYKHEPIDLLERNSISPYGNLKPKINSYHDKESRITNYELCTTHLFKYLIKNINKDKKRLAATAQLYIAEGLYKIIKKIHNSKFIIHNSYLAGGISNNKIISSYLESTGAIANKKIYPVKSKFNGVPRGDAGISFGQIIYQLIK